MKKIVLIDLIVIIALSIQAFTSLSRRSLAADQTTKETLKTALASVTERTKTAATRAETRENSTTTAQQHNNSSTAKHTTETTKAAETKLTAKETTQTTTEATKATTEATTKGDIYVTVIATAYCPCNECSEGYGRQTASGATATAGRTIAVDPLVFPYGTKLLINGVVYVAEDCGGDITGNEIDIFFDTHAEVEAFGRRELKAQIVS